MELIVLSFSLAENFTTVLQTRVQSSPPGKRPPVSRFPIDDDSCVGELRRRVDSGAASASVVTGQWSSGASMSTPSLVLSPALAGHVRRMTVSLASTGTSGCSNAEEGTNHTAPVRVSHN